VDTMGTQKRISANWITLPDKWIPDASFVPTGASDWYILWNFFWVSPVASFNLNAKKQAKVTGVNISALDLPLEWITGACLLEPRAWTMNFRWTFGAPYLPLLPSPHSSLRAHRFNLTLVFRRSSTYGNLRPIPVGWSVSSIQPNHANGRSFGRVCCIPLVPCPIFWIICSCKFYGGSLFSFTFNRANRLVQAGDLIFWSHKAKKVKVS